MEGSASEVGPLKYVDSVHLQEIRLSFHHAVAPCGRAANLQASHSSDSPNAQFFECRMKFLFFLCIF